MAIHVSDLALDEFVDFLLVLDDSPNVSEEIREQLLEFGMESFVKEVTRAWGAFGTARLLPPCEAKGPFGVRCGRIAGHLDNGRPLLQHFGFPRRGPATFWQAGESS